ncbi:8544_t:CDS:2, partial [Racocetra fulgida]
QPQSSQANSIQPQAKQSQVNSIQSQPSQQNSNQPQPSQSNSNQNHSQPSPNPNSGDVKPTSNYVPLPRETSIPPKPANSQKKIPITKHYTSTADVCSDNPHCKTDGKTETIEDKGYHITTIIPPGYDSSTITAFVTRVVTVTVTVYVPGYTSTITDYKNGEPISYETYYPPSTKIILETVTSVAPADFAFEESKARKLGHY